MKLVPELLRSPLSSSARHRAPPFFYELLSSSRNALDHLRAPRLVLELPRSSTSSSARPGTLTEHLRAPRLVPELPRSSTSSSARPRTPRTIKNMNYERLVPFKGYVESLVYKVQLSRQSEHKETRLSGQPELLALLRAPQLVPKHQARIHSSNTSFTTINPSYLGLHKEETVL